MGVLVLIGLDLFHVHQFTKTGHIFVCVHLNEEINMVMDEDGGDANDHQDGEVESPEPPIDQYNTLSGKETADYRNSWEMFERLLAQEYSYQPSNEHNSWDYSDVVNLVVSVEDTGVGIPLHVQERVFTPFMQVKSMPQLFK